MMSSSPELFRLLSLVVFLAIIPAAFGSTVILTDDVYVSSHQAGKNFNSGNDPGLAVDGESTSFLRFDFSALPPGTSQHLVVKATLVVFVRDLSAPGAFDVPRAGTVE